MLETAALRPNFWGTSATNTASSFCVSGDQSRLSPGKRPHELLRAPSCIGCTPQDLVWRTLLDVIDDQDIEGLRSIGALSPEALDWLLPSDLISRHKYKTQDVLAYRIKLYWN